jgi:hypothetical protein
MNFWESILGSNGSGPHEPGREPLGECHFEPSEKSFPGKRERAHCSDSLAQMIRKEYKSTYGFRYS